MQAYLRDIKQSRFYSREEEHDLALKAKSGDREARDALIRSLLPFVVTFAKRYCRRHDLPLEDAVQAGNLGLMRAVDQFDPHRGTRLSTFAGPKILQQIHYHGERDSLIHVPPYLFNASNPDAWHVTPEERKQFALLRSTPLALEHPVPAPEPPECADETELVELRRNIARLPARLRAVIRYRMAGERLSEVAARLGVTRERVRQLEGVAVKKLLNFYGLSGRTFTMSEAMRS